MNRLSIISYLLVFAMICFPSCGDTDNTQNINSPVTGTYLRMEESGNFITSYIVIDIDGAEFRFEHEYVNDWKGNFDGDLEALTDKKIKITFDEFTNNYATIITTDGQGLDTEINPEWKKIFGIFDTDYTVDDIGSDMPQEFTISTATRNMTFDYYLMPEDFQLKGESVTVYYSTQVDRYANEVEVL